MRYHFHTDPIHVDMKFIQIRGVSKQKVHQARISVSMIPRGMKSLATKFLKVQPKLLFSKLSCRIYILGAALIQIGVCLKTTIKFAKKASNLSLFFSDSQKSKAFTGQLIY